MLNLTFIKETGPLRWLLRMALRQLHKRVVRREQTMRLWTGNSFLLPLRSACATEIFVTDGNMDWGVEALLAALLTGRGCFLDVGANIGFYSVLLEPLVTRVLAFEPDARARATLERNVAGLTAITIMPVAVGDRDGTAAFCLDDTSETSHLAADGEGISVRMVTLDAVVGDQQLTVEAIKTDVEGHDLEVLHGARSLLATQRPIVVSELQPDAAVVSFAASVGYAVLAFARHRQTREICFIHLDESPIAGLVFKMLILCPSERMTEVTASARELLAQSPSTRRVVAPRRSWRHKTT